MPQQPIELILTRQWASYLAVPVWVMGENGHLSYYNEPAETVLGRRFDEAGEMPAEELATIFQTTSEDGSRLNSESLPINIALLERRHVLHEDVVGVEDPLDRELPVLRRSEVDVVPLLIVCRLVRQVERVRVPHPDRTSGKHTEHTVGIRRARERLLRAADLRRVLATGPRQSAGAAAEIGGTEVEAGE